ncbi:MAG: hypothetical protein MHPSP_002024 [Paramarteilia canceri]
MNKYLINGSDDTNIGNEWKTTNQNCYIKPENYNISKNTYKKFDTPNLISGSLGSTLYKFQSSLNKSDYKDPGKVERRALIVPKKNGNIVSYDTTPNQMTSSYGSSYSTKKFGSLNNITFTLILDKSAQEICNKLRSKQLNTFRLDNNLRNDDGTTNKRKLTQWWENIEKSRVTNALHMIKCPAEGLKNQSGLVDRNGHQFYVKVQ